ncbi:hypothetical protein I3843_02G040100 [Carya illinoinensis]|nr:hypothetical protein I3843_02G040100 [Carya illinoinensis]
MQPQCSRVLSCTTEVPPTNATILRTWKAASEAKSETPRTNNHLHISTEPASVLSKKNRALFSKPRAMSCCIWATTAPQAATEDAIKQASTAQLMFSTTVRNSHAVLCVNSLTSCFLSPFSLFLITIFLHSLVTF